MVKLYFKKSFKKLPEIIIVEGFWNLGKTKLINRLSKKHNYTIIPEPNHLTKKIKRGVSKWYRQEHWKRHQLAIKQIKHSKKIIMERSIISSLAFDYARLHKFSIDLKESLIRIKKLDNLLVIFLYGEKNFIKKRLLELKPEDHLVRKQVLNNPIFYRNYLDFYQKILPKFIDARIIFIKINNKTEIADFLII